MIPMAEEQQAVQAETSPEEQPAPSIPKKAKPAHKTLVPDHAAPTMLVEKYSYDVTVNDLSLRNYIDLKPMAYPASYRRTSEKMFSKANLNIVERLENAIMRGGTGKKIGGHVIRTKGRLQGKKLKAMHILEQAFDAVHTQTRTNPLQVYIMALETSAPIEDTTRIRQGGTVSNIPVDISASRRLDTALRNIATAAIMGAFSNRRTISQALANELILASKNDVNSYAVKRKNEIERMARSAK